MYIVKGSKDDECSKYLESRGIRELSSCKRIALREQKSTQYLQTE